MASTTQAKTDPREQLLDQLGKSIPGILGVQGSHSHMQPMAPMLDREAGRIWFFTKRNTDLVREVGAGAHGHFCLISRSHDYHACIGGRMTPSSSREIVDRYWNPMIAAWYEQGKDDPQLILLEFRMKDAAVWASTGSSVVFGWEIAKANLTGNEPDVGHHTVVTF